MLLVRHAQAGDRDSWAAPDRERPVTEEGARQAAGLVAALAEFEVTRILSSPYLRCIQTVAPLAAARGLTVQPSDDLVEGRGRAALALVDGCLASGASAGVVLCTHGDVLEDVLDGLGVSRSEETEKGATWVLEPGRSRCLPPPG